MTETQKSIFELFSEKFVQDLNSNISLEKKFTHEIRMMEKNGLNRRKSYEIAVGIKVEQSYYTAYLYRLFDYLKNRSDLTIENFSLNDRGIKNMIQTFKKGDVNKARRQRKDIGDYGVNFLKKRVNRSIDKVNQYIENIQKDIDKLSKEKSL